ncbi:MULTISPECIES: ATP-binding cassette domain-containing protein [unclassified Anaerobiospirillum]|uniref:ATP-binding cassette domain-containing protein n=1 Tax=unclassified Anaerobiospirillum TaxID=2647410 RepID=UPI001FF19F62|nr:MULTISPECIES: ATP-binding cassette domain-containing protein [unclassified Anaerobiospirillum]MCK0533672.1 ATP-binding cassette domain-containing protein [Anaerobiospirillum sp. NML120511]MCK0539635.1 ATP-binding cassette domain-containing protein [Anaerobiospirillum sp. NML02-A-032]
MALITMMEASLAYGDDALLSRADFALEEGERVCLVGRNGTGKSTLLKLFDHRIELDDGRMIFRDGLRINRLAQDPPQDAQGTVYSMVARGIDVVGDALASFKESTDPREQERLAAFIEQHDGWIKDALIFKILNKIDLDPDTPLSSLSGGWRRKAALAAALANEPQVLLLDEPTNHLDIATIAWLEEYLLGFKGTVVFVSHDRTFADHLATRIVELDRGKLYSYPGAFDDYLRLRDERLRLEELQRADFDRVLAEEEAWIRRGVKARLARNEGRVRNLEAMRKERSERRDRQGRAIIKITEADRSGNIVFEADNITVTWDGRDIIKNFSPVVMRGDRIGIVGPNGAGKTTLIKVLMGLVKPDHGYVRIGTNVESQYFDQYHEQLEPAKSVADNVAEGKQDVPVNGRTVHVLSYLKNFLFTARRARSPVSVLSGGEKNRLMLARIFARPCNVLIMDEPTNDLDLETLDLLEEMLQNFPGTVLVISHDRRFIDEFATETWVFDGNGHIETVVGGWSDVEAYYRRIGKNAALVVSGKDSEPEKAERADKADKSDKGAKDSQVDAAAASEGSSKSKSNKLSFTEAHELEALPEKIELKEEELAAVDAQIADPALYSKSPDEIKAVNNKRAELAAELDALYERFELLMDKSES